jgi:hypothetical protein
MATQSLPTSLSSTGGTGRDYAWNDALNRSGMEPLVPSEEQLQLFRNYEVQTCQEGGVEIVVRVPKTIADGTVEDHFGYMFSFGGGGFVSVPVPIHALTETDRPRDIRTFFHGSSLSSNPSITWNDHQLRSPSPTLCFPSTQHVRHMSTWIKLCSSSFLAASKAGWPTVFQQ